MEDILYLFDPNGQLYGVQLSPTLWKKVESYILSTQQIQAVEEVPEPLGAWEEFKQYWDFKYPFCAKVECLHCGARSDDWEHDLTHKFRLRTANLGGLLVFRCINCGASIRKKHFKDHMVFEVTPPASAAKMLRSGNTT